jgi:large subunit ribosomal protein L28
MAKICTVCTRGPQVANLVSHANNKTKRWTYPNVHKMRFTLPGDTSKVCAGAVCTRCVKAGKVKKIV